MVNLSLSPEKINIILAHLARGTYSEVADLIIEIHTQAMAQIQAEKVDPPDAS